MTFTTEQVDAVRKAYPDAWEGRDAEREDDSALAFWALRDARRLERRFSWGPDEPCAVDVHGVVGAYFFRSIELDDHGVFSTLDEAWGAAADFFECRGLFATAEESLAFAESSGWI